MSSQTVDSTAENARLRQAARAHYVIYQALKADGFLADSINEQLTLMARAYGFIVASIPPDRRSEAFDQIREVGYEIAERLTALYGYPPKLLKPN